MVSGGLWKRGDGMHFTSFYPLGHHKLYVTSVTSGSLDLSMIIGWTIGFHGITMENHPENRHGCCTNHAQFKTEIRTLKIGVSRNAVCSGKKRLFQGGFHQPEVEGPFPAPQKNRGDPALRRIGTPRMITWRLHNSPSGFSNKSMKITIKSIAWFISSRIESHICIYL